MPLNFPTSPTIGQTYITGGLIYTWDSSSWTATKYAKASASLISQYTETGNPSNFVTSINSKTGSVMLNVPTAAETLTFTIDTSNNTKAYGLVAISSSWKNGDTTLKGLQIGYGVNSIGSYAFYQCTNLSGSLVIPDSVTTIERSAFYNCQKLHGPLVIPDSVTSIGVNSFAFCYGFTSLDLGKNLTTISTGSFADCAFMVGHLNIPSSVTTISDYAFSNAGFTSLTLNGIIPSWGNYCFINVPISTITITGSITNIGSQAFYQVGATNIIVGNSVTNLSTYAFNSAQLVVSMSVAPSVTNISSYAFYNCDALKYATIYGTTTSLGDNAFSNNPTSSLSRLNFYSPTSSVSSNAFYGLSGTQLHVRSSDTSWTAGSQSIFGGTVTVTKDL